MLVAIVLNQGSGKVAIEEVREASSTSDAVTAFCNEYTPPKIPADYYGYDTGWSDYQFPDEGKYWAYDFDSPGLVQESLSDSQLAEECCSTSVMTFADTSSLPLPPPKKGLLVTVLSIAGVKGIAISTDTEWICIQSDSIVS